MRLYPRAGQASVVHDGNQYDAAADGSFELPEHVGRHLHSFHAGGKPLWETDIERQNRLIAEEMERRKDPATLLDAVEQLVSAAKESAAAKDGPEPARPARAAAAKADASTGK